LVVHLKRFSSSRYSRDKLDTPVDFPLTGLDLVPYLLSRKGEAAESAPSAGADAAGQSSDALYDLYAVSNHYGGLGGGHYTAYCRMPDDGRWHVFDDSSVREVSASEVVSPAAYVLFYRRRVPGREDDVERMVAAAARRRREVEEEVEEAGPPPRAAPVASPRMLAGVLEEAEAEEEAAKKEEREADDVASAEPAEGLLAMAGHMELDEPEG
jgi:ubiquitin carboxyl-terminal hydrolase 4/11